MKKIIKGDKVIVLAGKYKGSIGVVSERVSPVSLLVENLFLSKKHQKPNPSVGRVGGIVQKRMPVHQSKLALIHPETGKACRVGFSVVNGKFARVVAGTNVLLAVIFGSLLRYSGDLGLSVTLVDALVLATMANLVLAIFNLIPRTVAC